MQQPAAANHAATLHVGDTVELTATSGKLAVGTRGSVVERPVVSFFSFNVKVDFGQDGVKMVNAGSCAIVPVLPLQHEEGDDFLAPVGLDTHAMRDATGYVPSDIQDDVAKEMAMRSQRVPRVPCVQRVQRVANGGPICSALRTAAQSGHKVVVEALLARGADVDDANGDGDTALKLAAVRGHQGIVGVLLAGGAAVNARDSGGVTPLMWAAYNGHAQVCSQLLAGGAAVNARNNERQTALYLVPNRRSACATVLQGAGGTI
eukprot:COSAG03_NODE_236_length_10176_cov_27.595217_2_plen_262_part_00